jgi:hypothetical protein
MLFIDKDKAFKQTNNASGYFSCFVGRLAEPQPSSSAAKKDGRAVGYKIRALQ